MESIRTDSSTAFGGMMASGLPPPQSISSSSENARSTISETPTSSSPAGSVLIHDQDEDEESPKKILSSPSPLKYEPLANAPRHRQISTSAAVGGSKVALKPMRLHEYLYKEGYLKGSCSDITFKAFNKAYNLHKLILHRSPYFSALFSGNWKESDGETMHEINFDFDENITQEAFELALARLYGHEDAQLEAEHLYGLFAVASFLDLPDLIDSCVSQLIRAIRNENVSEIVAFCTKYDYGRGSAKVAEGCRSFICSEGHQMELEHLDAIPEKVLAEVLCCDGFFIQSEWERCDFIYKVYAYKAQKLRERCQNQDLKLSVSSLDSVERGDEDEDDEDEDEGDQGAFPRHELEKLAMIQDALNTGVHFCHLSGDQLIELQKLRDINDKPLISREALRDGLWLQHELRQKVTHVSSVELGLTQMAWEQDDDLTYFSIPAEEGGSPKPQKYSRFPPFRFSVQFDNVGALRDRERWYSDTYWAAGSYWNLYIQRNSLDKGQQIGVYLHRGKLDSSGNLVRDGSSSSMPPGLFLSRMNYEGDRANVEEQVALAFSSNLDPHGTQTRLFGRRESEHETPTAARLDVDGLDDTATFNTSSFFGTRSPTPQTSSMFEPFTGNQDANTSPTHRTPFAHLSISSGSPLRVTNNTGNATTSSAASASPYSKAEYVDTRKKISAYFEIYTPSRRGKCSLTCFSSSPDNFDFAQAWGWKSQSLANEQLQSLKFMVVIGVI